jgi:hypothetical protein
VVFYVERFDLPHPDNATTASMLARATLARTHRVGVAAPIQRLLRATSYLFGVAFVELAAILRGEAMGGGGALIDGLAYAWAQWKRLPALKTS